MPRILTIILGAVALLGAIFGIRALMNSGEPIATVRAETVPTLDKPLPDVQTPREGMQVAVRRSVAAKRPLYLSLPGRTEASRTVTVKSEGTGTVTAAPAAEGSVVERGDLLCALDVQTRGAKVREAEADAAQKLQAYNRAVDEAARGWAPQSRIDTTKTQLDESQAALDLARADLAKMQMRAPFRGVFEKRLADVGEFLGAGGSCGVVVELDPVLVVTEDEGRRAAQIAANAPARLKLTDGTEAKGQVRYVAKTADPTTRMFRIEVEVPNPSNAIPVGRVAEVRIQVGEGDAHRIDPSLLTLDDQGRIGVRYLDVGGVVAFAPADIVDESVEGTWIAGLPREALIVDAGQESVVPGLRATPVVREDTPPTPANATKSAG